MRQVSSVIPGLGPVPTVLMYIALSMSSVSTTLKWDVLLFIVYSEISKDECLLFIKKEDLNHDKLISSRSVSCIQLLSTYCLLQVLTKGATALYIYYSACSGTVMVLRHEL